MNAKVVVVGSLNMDLVARAQRLPRAGETLPGESFFTVPGGKGANQAVAVARLGGSVAMIGNVGDDDYGRQLHRALYVEGIDCQGVSTCPGVSSGVALITVDAASQNCIVIIPGANGLLTPRSVQRFDALLQAAEVIICQLEVPAETVAWTLARGHELGKQVILNPAPATGPLPADWFAHIDYLTPNESEAEALTGMAVTDQESARRAGERLLQLGAGKVIITLGAQGALRITAQGHQHYPASVVQPLDTTAAGDTFVGGFAAGLVRGLEEGEAIVFGQRAAALSVTRAGAQPSIPYLAELTP
ncbi:TPA: ribokinase [Pseudomonas putida]|jgi:ribokinase|uniref:Ribokinase n=1 Tax=Pseudomonas putida (strain GB-1) TaxID=76869 RepID=B0KKS5_PSEPG|nr:MULTISPECIES: ribokinase [Pseudomonas]ABY99379.1 ribokinase [Pseudomonas putida GB-1]APE99529.1 ribokinase [Pseudomonas putida]MBP0706994.1 ribokinase [Pseudomonas sp. T34]MCE1000100.1 ribokinase [Pseudomonas sp. NMI1173_11]MCK2186433.1 ribokinase [Pseudomonas sp. MB04B]